MRFLRSLLDRVLTDNISFLAGGVAFYGLLALFPAMAGLVSLFGLMADVRVVGEYLNTVRMLFPPQVFSIIQQQMMTLLSQPPATLSLTAVFSLLLTLYSATRGTKAILAALNAVFRVHEGRSWLFQQIEAFLLTVGTLLLMIIALFMIVGVPVLLKFLPIGDSGNLGHLLEGLRWLILFMLVFCGLFILFIFGPNRKSEGYSMRTIFWGAYIATALWVAVSVGGSVFMQLVPMQIGAAYGSLSAIILMMLWIYSTAYIVLIGGAITAVTEER